MKPDTQDILLRYQALRESLGDAANHWPTLSAGGVTVHSELVNSKEALHDKLHALLDVPPTPGLPAANVWQGWWQTTDTVSAGEWPGCAVALGPGITVLLDGEWTRGDRRSIQVRHVGGKWRVTCLEEGTDSAQDMVSDVMLEARASYATALTYRVYLGWDERRGRIAPHAARLREIRNT